MPAACAADLREELLARVWGPTIRAASRQDAHLAAKCVHCALACLKHPVVVAQCRNDPNMASPGQLAAFILSALKA